MTRRSRRFLSGRLYHLISRFVDREWFISTESEREHYLRLLGRALDTTDWRCLAYAVMSNHIHLAMIAGQHTLGSWLRRVHSPFADAMNKTHDRIGPMFVRGPKDVFTPHERAAALLAYIHNNPVRAGIVSNASQSQWTSHRAYIGDAAVPRWLHVSEGLQLAAATRAEFDQLVRTAPSATDSDDAQLLELEFEPPDELEPAVCVDELVELAAVEVGLSLDDVRSRRKQNSHVLARRVVSRCGDRLGASGTQIARALGTTAQCVSKILLHESTDEVERHLVERVLRQVGDRAVNTSRKL
jgi:REP element-mobilizing transposase RayT